VARHAIDFFNTLVAKLHPARRTVWTSATTAIMMHHGTLPYVGSFRVDSCANSNDYTTGLVPSDDGGSILIAKQFEAFATRRPIKL
jgi:hypothetical protein